MLKIRILVPFALILVSLAAPARAIEFDLRLDRLADAFQLLPQADQGAVSEIVNNIKNGENAEALRRLNELNKANPDNSSLRVLTAYAMLQLGNLFGAFEQADKAHEAPNGNSYKCLFYSKVALLNGNTEACQREIGHVKKVGDMPQEVKKMEAQLAAKRRVDMFGLDTGKTQQDDILVPQDQPPEVIISPDSRRANRIPPGQSRTKKWPVLDASGTPRVSMDKWRFQMVGLIGKEISFDWKEFLQLPRIKVFADFHCVTRWSRLGNVWEGVSTRHLVELAGGVKSDAGYALAYGYDHGWTTNLSVENFLSEDALVALTHDGEPLTDEHGGPARLIVPQLYAWKSAKWLAGIEVLAEDRAGFWERNGYHMHGDPWLEERFGY